MTKKLLSLLLALTMVFCMAGCVTKDGGSSNAGGGYEIALITDSGSIDDKSFNQGSWEGLKAYAEEKGITHKYYEPAEQSDEAMLSSIELAVKGGAKVIVTPGYVFEAAVASAQETYPEVKFIILDAAPVKNGEVYIADNTVSIYYAEEESGFLAGYAAVKEGYRKLGFMGGIAVPAVMRFGYGYVQGADAAAKELGLAAGEVTLKYTYVGNFDASPENNAKAAAWYNEGVECIFACGGGVGNSVMKAAETTGNVVIGVDVDQCAESETVMTSATKNLQKSVYDAIASAYDGSFAGGTSVTLGAYANGVQLPMDTARFKNFTVDDYSAIYDVVKAGGLNLLKDTDAADASQIPTEVVKVETIK